MNWDSTPLGPMDRWPGAVRGMLTVCLDARVPAAIWFGLRHGLVYNEQFSELLPPGRHPSCLGHPVRDALEDLWQEVGQTTERLLGRQIKHWQQDVHWPRWENGRPLERYLTLSCSPIHEQQQPIGVFCLAQDRTLDQLSRRRVATLRSAGGAADAVGDIASLLNAAVGENPQDLPFLMIYSIRQNGREAELIASAGLEGKHQAAPPHVKLLDSQAAWPLASTLRSGRWQVVNDLPRRFGKLGLCPWPEEPQEAVLIPLRVARQPAAAVLIAGLNPRLPVDEAYSEFLDLLAHQLATLLASVPYPIELTDRERGLVQRVQAAEVRLNSVLANVKDGLVVVNHRWQVLYVNDNAAQMLQQPRLVGRDFWKNAPPSIHSLKPQLQQAMRNQASDQFEVLHQAQRRWFELRVHPWPEGLSVLLTDITDRKQAELALRSSEARFRGIFDQSHIGMALVQLDGTLMQVNQKLAQLLGYSPDELVGKNFRELTHPDDLPADNVLAQRLVTGQIHTYSLEKRFVCQDQRPRWTRITCSMIHQLGDVAPFVAGIVEDITQRKQAEQQLIGLNETLEQRVQERTAIAEQRAEQLRALAIELTHAEQRERRRLARVLHDHVQQLLVAARLRADAFRGRTKDRDLEASLHQMHDLLNQAIHASRSLAVELSPPVLHDAGLIPALHWLARRQRHEHGLHIDLDISPDAEPASVDTRLFLFRAAHELLFNIVKHAQVPEARVQLRRLGHQIVLIVEDRGAGFDINHLTMDDRFGLYNITQRAELLGGRFNVNSSPGKGTRIYLTVPSQAESTDPRMDLD